MNETGVVLLWCVIQVTLNLLVGGAVYLLVRRMGPATGAAAAACTLAMLCGVTVAAFCPWPRWWSLAAHQQPEPVIAAEEQTAKRLSELAAAGLAPATGEQASRRTPATGLSLADYWALFGAELTAASAAQSGNAARRWPTFLAVLLVAAGLLAMGRFLIGIAALRRYRSQLSPVCDARLAELAASLAQELGCRRAVAITQSASLTTPATIGWRRPLVVLPGDWQSWSDAERRVVLAHELAHIARGDYATWLLAQVAVALHVYHPLVHWLSRRLRLEQELAADACAAELAGGRELYLFTLAQMALRQDDRRIAWAARPFLPTRGTLLRRIEMLSDTKRLKNRPLSRRRALTLAGAAGLVALVTSAFRAPLGSDHAAQAAPGKKATSSTEAGAAAPLDITYLAPHAVAVVAVRPARLLGREGMEPLAKILNEGASPESVAGIKLENVEQIAFSRTSLTGPARQSSLSSWRSKDAFDWRPYAKTFAGEGEPIEVDLAGKKYFKSALPAYYHPVNPEEAQRFAFYLPDDRSIVMGPENLVRQAIVSAGRAMPEWADDWRQVATGECAAMVDLIAVRDAIVALRKEAPQAANLGPLLAFAPLWEKGRRLFSALHADQGLNLTARIDCANAEGAGDVEQTTRAALTLARNMLQEFSKRAIAAPDAGAAAALPLSDLAVELVKQGELRSDGEKVTFQSQLELDVAETALTTLIPAAVAARASARRSMAMNNLKQIMLGLHVYHDIYGHFPPPVVLGPDGKTPHSWRVAILPFIEQQKLYGQYHLDEPWDSENNKKVLAQMPAVYRDPGAELATLDTSYFALVGSATALGPKDGKGTKLQDITDGTSNTIAIVEAKRTVPWTKPEDIDYDPAQPLPKLGGLHAGGFLATFADGSVHVLMDNTDQQRLRALISKAGGEPITHP